jgi:hypothetical protein
MAHPLYIHYIIAIPPNGTGWPANIIPLHLRMPVVGTRHNTQNYWIFGLLPSSGILGTRKHDVSETGSVSFLRCGGETPTQLGALELTSITGQLLSDSHSYHLLSGDQIKGKDIPITGRGGP